MKALHSSSALPSDYLHHRHGSSSSRCCRAQQQQQQCRSVSAGAVVEPAQLAAIAAEPVAEVALLAAVGAVCARQGLLPLQGR